MYIEHTANTREMCSVPYCACTLLGLLHLFRNMIFALDCVLQVVWLLLNIEYGWCVVPFLLLFLIVPRDARV